MSELATTSGPRSRGRHHVVIVGGGVGGLEAMLALGEARADLDVTLIAPNAEYVERPMSVAAPFGAGHAARMAVAAIAAGCGATVVKGRLDHVDAERHVVVTAAGDQVRYDALVLAVGAQPYLAVPGAVLWTADTTPEIMGGLLRDMEEHYSRSVAFVQPAAPCWPLPVYELAMMCARDAYGMGIDDAKVCVVTPESAPLIAFGAEASAVVAAELSAARVTVHPDAGPRIERHGLTLSIGSGEDLTVDRVVALPGLRGPAVAGLPCDEDGFLIVDERGRVADVAAIWAVGDGTNGPIKHGGLTAQQADLTARDILARARGDDPPEAQAPVLRGMLLTGAARLWLQRDLDRKDPGQGADYALWQPASKIAGSRLGDLLAVPAPPSAPDGHVVETLIPGHHPAPLG